MKNTIINGNMSSGLIGSVAYVFTNSGKPMFFSLENILFLALIVAISGFML